MKYLFESIVRSTEMQLSVSTIGNPNVFSLQTPADIDLDNARPHHKVPYQINCFQP